MQHLLQNKWRPLPPRYTVRSPWLRVHRRIFGLDHSFWRYALSVAGTVRLAPDLHCLSGCQEWEGVRYDMSLHYNAWGSVSQKWGRNNMSCTVWGSAIRSGAAIISALRFVRLSTFEVGTEQCLTCTVWGSVSQKCGRNTMWLALCEAQKVRSRDGITCLALCEAQHIRSGDAIISALRCVRLSKSEVWTEYYVTCTVWGSVSPNWGRNNISLALCEAQYIRSGDGTISDLYCERLSKSEMGTE
jgi:hypothetical protein